MKVYLLVSLIIHLLAIGVIYSTSRVVSNDVVWEDVPVMLYTVEDVKEFIVEEEINEPEDEVGVTEESTNAVAEVGQEFKEASHTDSEIIGDLKIVYPKTSKRRGEEGIVQVNVTVSSEGICTLVEMSTSSGFKRLDEAAMKSLSKMKYRPSTDNGVEVSSSKMFEVAFQLTD